jgi:GxxExxY protein
MFRRKEKDEEPSSIVVRKLEIPDDVIEKFGVITEMCNEVYCSLGKGFAESVYEEALCIELQHRNIHYVSQETLPILYKNRFIGNIRLDILLHSWLPFVFELKAVAGMIHTDDRWQVVRYMSRKDVLYGAVVNFNQSISKGLEISFIAKNCDDKYYIVNLETLEGKLLRDACPDS